MFFLLLVDCLFLRVFKIRQPDKLDIVLFFTQITSVQAVTLVVTMCLSD